MHRVALIGAGGISAAHAMSYPRIENAELAAVMDADPETASKMGEQYDVPAFSDAAQLFAEAEFDTIDICTPTPFHLEYIKMGAAAGKTVICEKPLCRTVEECREAISTCDKAGVRLFVAQCLRWDPPFRRAKELIDAGTIGEPAIVRTTRASGHPGRWFSDVDLSGGVVFDMSIHDFDWLIWTFGPAVHVFSRGMAYTGGGKIDYALTTIRFKKGVIAHVESSWATPEGFYVEFEVAGDKGLIDYSNATSSSLTTSRWNEDQTCPVVLSSSPTDKDLYLMELEHFFQCLDDGAACEVSPKEGLNAVMLAAAALESQRTGAPVSVKM